MSRTIVQMKSAIRRDAGAARKNQALEESRAEARAMDLRLMFIEAIARGETVCVMCGCSDFNACPEGCEWSVVFRAAPVGVCSSCVKNFKRRVSPDDK